MRMAIEFGGATCVALIVCLGALPAAAKTCAERPVMARGEPSRFEVLAKTKARANWRARVRATPALGAAYADFSKALAPEYRCTEAGSRFTCTAIAHPCRD